MTSSENDYTAMLNQDNEPEEKTMPTSHRKRFNVTTPGETADKMAVTLPITDAAETVPPTPTASEAVSTEELNDNDTNAEGDVIDSGNNYTAAENDHDSNATL